MSNLLKSKFLIGVMTVAIMFVGFAFANTASADCSITSTLRVGSKGTQVVCLQTFLDHAIVADGAFGPKTKAAVVAWQKTMDLVADGIFGAKSNKVWASNSSPLSGNFPSGCTSASGYSSTTGLACVSLNANVFPAGCTNASGFSPTTGASCATGAVNNQTGPVTASFSLDNPASGYIIANQATADLLHVTFSGVGTVNTIVLQRTGISDQNTLANVYLYDGAVRLTDGYSFNNVGQLTMNSLGIAVNGSKTISVKADVANVFNASSLGVTLVGFTAAGQTATVVSVKGNEMSYGVGSLATITIGANTVSSPATVNAGTSAYTVWSTSVQVNTRAVWLKGANFRMTGSAPADALGNIKLYVDGLAVGGIATVGSITGSNYAMFDFSATPVSLSTGSHTLDLRADVVKGASYTVQTSLQQAADLVVYDGQVGVNIAVQNPNLVPFTTNAAATITIAAGSASVNIDPTFQSQTNIVGGATNIAIGRFKIHGYGEDVKVTTLGVTPVLTGMFTGATSVSGQGLNNLTVYFNGTQVGPSQAWTSGTASFNLGSQMIIPAGSDSYVEVRADLQTNAGVNYTAGSVSANLAIGTSNGQGQTSHITLNFPTNTVVGTVLTVQTGTLLVTKNTSYATQVASPNTNGVKIGSFTLQNQSTSEGVRVTSLLVTLTGTSSLTNLSGLRTSETSGSGATEIQPQASNTFSVDFTLAPSATKIIDIFANSSSDIAGTLVANVDVTQAIAVATSTAGTTGTSGTAAFNTVTITDTDGSTAVAPSAISATVNGSISTFNANAAAGVTATAGEIAAAAAGLTSAINANGAVNSTVIATSSAGVITITSRTVGTGGNTITLTAAGTTAGGFTAAAGGSTLASGVASTSTAQVSTLTPSGVITVSDTFTFGVGANLVTYTGATSVGTATAGITALWNATSALAAIATASDTGSLVNLTSRTLGANTFVPVATAANGVSSSAAVTVITHLTLTSRGVVSGVSLLQNGDGIAEDGQTITFGAGVVQTPTATSASTANRYIASLNGATNAAKATFNFKSTGGPATITELTFSIGGTAGSIASVTVNGITAPAGTTAHVFGLNIQVPQAGAGVNQDVFVTYVPVGVNGLASGSTASITLTDIKYQSGGLPTTLSGLSVGGAYTMTLVGSKPTLTMVDSASPLTNGLVKAGSVTVTADAQGDIAINTLPFAFISTGNVTSTLSAGVSLKNAADQSVVNTSVASSANLTAGGSNGRLVLNLTDTGGFPIQAGTSVTFDLYVTAATVINGPGANTLSTTLGTTDGGGATAFTWTDVAGNSTTPVTGTLISNFPTNSSIIND